VRVRLEGRRKDVFDKKNAEERRDAESNSSCFAAPAGDDAVSTV
jgi:hypothetical protein